MPPIDRPVGPGQKPVEDMTADEAKLALAQARSSYPSDEDFETLLADTLHRVEESARSGRSRLQARITELEAKVSASPTP